MIFKPTVGAVVVCAVVCAAAPTAAQQWQQAKCELKPGHVSVNRGMLYVKSASETRFADKRQKDLNDAEAVLTQAVTSGGQEKNAAAWYYLARYYALKSDLIGTDSAFAKAAALAPQCKDDIAAWRRILWVPVFNEGVRAWQAGQTDSAIASFRQANAIYDGDPTGFVYLGTLLSAANQPDSSAKYFKLAVKAGDDPKFAKAKRDALFDAARVYHAAQRWDDAVAGYKDYLAVYPADVQAMAGLASVYVQQGKRDEAVALYTQIMDHADSAEATDLFNAAQAILGGIPQDPDTAPVGEKCRGETRAKSRTLTARQIAVKCEAVTVDTLRRFRKSIEPHYRLAARAYELGLTKNPYYRDALYNLSGIYYILSDTAHALPMGQRLTAIDPLNRSSLAALVRSWQLRGNKDSVLYYLTVADSLAVEVTVGSFTPGDSGATLGGVFTNHKAKPSPPVSVTFEFLNAKGDVVASQQQDVAAIDAEGNRPFELKVHGAGIVAWRYRKL